MRTITLNLIYVNVFLCIIQVFSIFFDKRSQVLFYFIILFIVLKLITNGVDLFVFFFSMYKQGPWIAGKGRGEKEGEEDEVDGGGG